MSSALLDHIIDCVRFHRDAGSSAEVEARAVADVAGEHVAKLLLASSRWEVTPERVHALTTLLTAENAPVAAEAERVVRAMLDVAVLAGISGGSPVPWKDGDPTPPDHVNMNCEPPCRMCVAIAADPKLAGDFPPSDYVPGACIYARDAEDVPDVCPVHGSLWPCNIGIDELVREDHRAACDRSENGVAHCGNCGKVHRFGECMRDAVMPT